MKQIDRMVRAAGLIMISAALLAIVASAALAQEGIPVAGDANSAPVTDIKPPPPLGNFTARGTSTNFNFVLGNCPDIQCSSGSACACNTGSGKAIATSLGKINFSVEFLSDANTFLANGKRIVSGVPTLSDCTGSSGLVTLTFGANTVNLDAGGLLCFTLHDQVVFTGTYTVTGGGGKYSAAYGAGNVSWVITSTAPGGIDNILFLDGTLAK